MGFPLGDWIDSHPGLPHDLAQSGMGPTLERVRRALRSPEPSDPDELRAELARGIGVSPERLFLTHGATEANALALSYLVRQPGTRGRVPRCAVPVPEYPPLGDAARLLGFRRVAAGEAAEVAVLSDPNNPRGQRWSDPAFHRIAGAARATLVDETFREFTDAPSRSARAGAGVWTSGTFTKVYGGDGLRVGYLVVPEPDVVGFGAFHAIVTDRVALASVGAARAILRDRVAILAEVRERFESNRRALQRAFPGVPKLDAPVWFDRSEPPEDGERLAQDLLKAGVLVCPGSYFGDALGVRICLTRATFPEDLDAYRLFRETGGTPAKPTGTAPTRSPRGRRPGARPAGG